MSSRRGRGRPPHPDLLTPAEWAVLDLVRHGMRRAEIARRRGTGVRGGAPGLEEGVELIDFNQALEAAPALVGRSHAEASNA